MSTIRLMAAVCVFLLAGTVNGQGARTGDVRSNDFSYTWVDLGYDMWEYDFGPGDGVDANALTARGSYALDEHLFMRGSLGFYSGDGDFDGNRLSVGLGFNTPLKQGLDLTFTGDLVRDDNDALDTENGIYLTGGVRHATTSDLELSGGLFYEDIYDNADDLGVYGQGLFHVNEQFDAGARLRLSGDIESIGLFGRYNF